MSPRLADILKKLLFVPPVALAIFFVVHLIQDRTGSPRRPPEERVTRVRVISVPRLDVVPRVFGTGVARARQTWDAVAQVSGRVIAAHEPLIEGTLLQEGTALIEIDPSDYRLAVDRSKAAVAEAEAKLAELVATRENDEAALEIERRSLAIAERDLERNRKMLDSGSVLSQSEFDDTERAVLDQRLTVRTIENRLRLLPFQDRAMAAQLDSFRAQLLQAELDLERTHVVSPFSLRLTDAAVEVGQYVASGQLMLSGDNVAATEVSAQVRIDEAQWLLKDRENPFAEGVFDSQVILETLRIDANVTLRQGEFRVDWPARFAGVSAAIHPRTRTVGFIVVVDDPYLRVVPGERPPLVPGMFVQVELRGPALPDTVVIPRSAVHEDHVYLVGDDRRLVRCPVTLGMVQTDLVVVDSGLSGEEILIVSDPIPAVDGMLLDPVPDPDREARLRASAGADRP